MKELSDYSLNPLSGNKPDNIVVLLHGYGDSGRGLIALAPYFQSVLPNTLFLAPNAPFSCEIAPQTGFQWFSLQEYTPEALFEGTQEAHPLLEAYLDKTVDKYCMEWGKIALVGFSQGTMMSLYTGLRVKGGIAGILGYSGALVGENSLNSVHKPPLRLIHGEDDSVVPVAAYHHAKEVLDKNDFDVSGYTTPNLGHSIDEKGIESGAEFLNKILN